MIQSLAVTQPCHDGSWCDSNVRTADETAARRFLGRLGGKCAGRSRHPFSAGGQGHRCRQRGQWGADSNLSYQAWWSCRAPRLGSGQQGPTERL